MKDQALAYRRLGWSVIPVCCPIPEKENWCTCSHHAGGDHTKANIERLARGGQALADPGKQPLVAWSDFQRRRPTESEIKQWWTRWPDANIGVITGATSGVIVLDADGVEAHAAVLSRGGFGDTPRVTTGKPSGFHWWFRHPGRRVTNFAGDRGVPGLDFRGDGGYVVAPPSLHRSGRRYTWEVPPNDLVPVPAPAWLLGLLDGGSGGTSSSSVHEPIDFKDVLDGIPEGTRDQTLWRLACKCRADDVPIEYAQLLLRQAAAACSPPFSESVALSKVLEAYRKYQPTPKLGGTGTKTAAPDQEEESESPPAQWEWRVMDGAAFLALDIPPLQWIVDRYLREQSVVFCYGPPGVLKTYLVLDLALAIVTGGEFLGQFPCTHGRVLFLQEDTSEGDFQQTYLAPMVRGLGITLEELANLFVAPPSGLTVDAYPERVAIVETWLAEHRPLLVAVDAYYLFHSSDGMTAKDIGPVMRVFRRWRTLYGCSVILIDHDRKAGNNTGRDSGEGDPIDRLYGGRAKSAGADAMWEMRRIAGEKSQAFLYVHKLRGGAPPDPVRVRLHDGIMTIDGERSETAEGTVRQVIEWFQRIGGNRTKYQIANGLNISPRSVERALGQLARENKIGKQGKDGHSIVWGLVSETIDDLPFK